MSNVKSMHRSLLNAYIENDSQAKRDLLENFEKMVDIENSKHWCRGVFVGFMVNLVCTMALLSILEII